MWFIYILEWEFVVELIGQLSIFPEKSSHAGIADKMAFLAHGPEIEKTVIVQVIVKVVHLDQYFCKSHLLQALCIRITLIQELIMEPVPFGSIRMYPVMVDYDTIHYPAYLTTIVRTFDFDQATDQGPFRMVLILF
jgi:hypothetical protein